MTDFPRLIEHAFPLEATSIDSVHEKNVRHGHISTLHIWPARRPLAACRAALIATLLPDPGDAEGRRELCEKIAGRVVKKIERKKMPNGQIVERVKKVTEGGILHWGRETENAETLDWFREEIRKVYGGRAPKVLDPFAGGGAIPLEAMRLGCEVTAVDINPVAWFILKCTLEYPQKLAGQTRPLPEFILHNDEFMTNFFKKAKGYSKTEIRAAMKTLHEQLKKKAKWDDQRKPQQTFDYVNESKEASELEADLAWHVRAWGQWVLEHARRDLAQYYPTYADFEPLKKDKVAYEHQPTRLLDIKEDGTADIDSLNGEFSEEYLASKGNPRWVAKPTVAYLWARTVTCKNCRAKIPLLKTLWLSKKGDKRALLLLKPNEDRTGTAFGIDTNVSIKGGNAAQRREHDKRISAGTMSRAGAQCPCCKTISTMDDIKFEGMADRLHQVLTAVVIETPNGKNYRLPNQHETASALVEPSSLAAGFDEVPFGEPTENIVEDAKRNTWCVSYGINQFSKLFTDRQRFTLANFVRVTRCTREDLSKCTYPNDWSEAISAGLTIGVDRIVDRQSMVCRWDMGYSKLQGTFTRFALPLTWDFCEGNPFSNTTGNYTANLEWVCKFWEHSMLGSKNAPIPQVQCRSATGVSDGSFDAIVTDPPYYDAIGYAVLMDFFYVWLRRTLNGLNSTTDEFFSSELTPKWDDTKQDGELIDDASRHGNDRLKSKAAYEAGMAKVFLACNASLNANGRLVVVFANKQADAWETLVSAVIKAGFVVDGSWPIQTEMGNRTRALSASALASSIWLVCKKRPITAKPGWDNKVLDEMRTNIATQLREFWDAGIRGPDFVWAATGPAMEAYSKHPVVRKALVDGEIMTVGEFLTHVRRMVVDYVVGQVLTGSKEKEIVAADRLDEVTAYYLLHRYDFKMDEAPVGACILYATACGLSDTELERTWDILARGGSSSSDDDDDNGDGDEESAGSGSKVKLKPWDKRTGRNMGLEAPEGRPVPIVDRIHRVMHLWKSGEVQKVDEFLDEHGLRRNELFKRVVQSLIELSSNGERALLESISNHIGAKGAIAERGPMLAFDSEED